MSVRSSQSEVRILRVLTGCTAVGKTELALRWAEKNGAEIVSCDSLLFYRGMNIGTAKPSASELERVPHHLIDVCDVAEQMDIGRFVVLARRAVDEIWDRGRTVLVTGGSGFYLKAFFSPVTDEIDVPESVRNEVRSMPIAEALEKLRGLNPDGLGKLDVANPRRVQRALERCLASGRTLEALVAAFARKPSAFHDWSVQLVRLDRDAAELNVRVEQRARSMLESGLVDEVEGLLRKGLRNNPSAARAIGYRETIAMIEGSLPPAELLATIVANTRALVKKQRTWFRTQLPPGRIVTARDATIDSLFA